MFFRPSVPSFSAAPAVLRPRVNCSCELTTFTVLEGEGGGEGGARQRKEPVCMQSGNSLEPGPCGDEVGHDEATKGSSGSRRGSEGGGTEETKEERKERGKRGGREEGESEKARWMDV